MVLAGCAAGSTAADANGDRANGASAGAAGGGRDQSFVAEGTLPPAPVEVLIEPVRPIPAGTSRRFVATVHNAGSTAVRWALGSANDAGSIDAVSGVYTAPKSGGRFTVTATSVEDPSAHATRDFEVAGLAVEVDPSDVSVAAGASYLLHATVRETGTSDVTWSVDEGAEGGAVDPETGAYTAPLEPGVYHVVATSKKDPTSQGIVTVSVPFTPIAIMPMLGTVPAGGTRAFGASVAGPSQAVTWSVLETDGGQISATGQYVAPVRTSGVFHVVATSVTDPSMTTTVPVLVGDVNPAIKNEGGPVLLQPTFVAVTFAGDALRSSLESFVAQYGQSSVWTAQTAEYGVGAATAGAPVRLDEHLPATMTDDDLQSWLLDKLDGLHPEFGIPTASTVYTIYVPRTTAVATSFGVTCAPLGGYHSFVTLPSGVQVPYAVVARCRGDNLDWVTQLTSHEYIEAVTDPLVNWNQAYAFSDDAHAIWGLMHPEVGDMCEWDSISSSTNVKPASLGYQIQRSWSNVAAAAGHEPCVPALDGEVYFTAMPALDESVTLTAGGQNITTRGVRIGVGRTRTIDVDLVSDGPRDEWLVYASDFGAGTLKFKFDRGFGASGDTVHLSITVVAKDKSYGGEPFEVVSLDGGETHSYYGFVAN